MKWNMKLIFSVCIVLAVVGPARPSDSVTTVQDLSVALGQKRDACANLAQEASNKADAAFLQVDLDRDTARRQVEMDANVYGIGHGRSQTTEFMIQKMREAAAASEEQTKRVSDQVTSYRHEVEQCVSDALVAGKALFSTFKLDKKHKKSLPEAETLMTAWIANSSEISIGKPQGSPETLAVWKSAKAHAEVSSL